MGNLKRFAKPTATIEHPNRPEIKFIVEKPRPEQALEFVDKRAMYERRVPAINPDTKEPIYDAGGNLQFIALSSAVPFSILSDYLKEHVKDIQGMKDGEGPVPYAGNEEDIFSELMQPPYFVTKQVPVMKDGVDTGKTRESKQLCTFWLAMVIHEEEFYRPLGATDSPKPSTDATAKPASGAKA